jgi:hypothetical protein
MAVRPLPKPFVTVFFPAARCGFLAEAALQKADVSGSSTMLRSFGFKLQAATISGEWFPSEHVVGDFK